MTGVALLAFDAVTAFVRIGCGLLFILRLLSCKEALHKKTMVWVSAAALAVAFAGFVTEADLAALALETVILTLFAVRLYGTEKRLSLFLGIFFEIAVALGVYLTSAAVGILCGAKQLPGKTEPLGAIAIVIFHGVTVLVGIYLIRRKELQETVFFRVMFAFMLMGLMATVALMDQELLSIPQDTRVMYLILSAVHFMDLQVFSMRKQQDTERENSRLKEEQAELLEREYKELNRTYAANAKLFHDFHNHIGVLRRYLVQGLGDSAINYLDELQAPLREMTDTVWSGDEALDYLINQKLAVAKELGIATEVKVEFPRKTNLKSADLSAILGNLLDNAIEAAKQVPEESERKVTLTIRRIYQMLVIKTENTFVTAPVTEDGTYRTTKKEGGLHGWGLKSAETAAEKYNGTLCAGTEDGVFRTVVTLYYEGVER